jgi:perosamine synthetase
MKITSVIPIAYRLNRTEEQEAVLRVLVSGQLAQGEKVAAFEKRFAELCQVREAVAVSSGTATLLQSTWCHNPVFSENYLTKVVSRLYALCD